MGSHSKYARTAFALRCVKGTFSYVPAMVSFESALPAFQVLSATSWSSQTARQSGASVARLTELPGMGLVEELEIEVGAIALVSCAVFVEGEDLLVWLRDTVAARQLRSFLWRCSFGFEQGQRTCCDHHRSRRSRSCIHRLGTRRCSHRHGQRSQQRPDERRCRKR